MTRWMLLTTLSLLCATARAADCVKSPDGQSVTCTAEGFGLLTREAILARGEQKTCALRLGEADAKVSARETAIQACEATLAAVKPCDPPVVRSLTKPLVGYGIGVISTVLMVTGLVAPLPDAVRYAVGGAGLVGLAGGVVLVVW